MPYDETKHPFRDRGLGREQFGDWGSSFTVAAADVDLSPYAYVRVFAPATLVDPVLRYIPARNADAAPVDMPLVAGGAEVAPHVVRRILGSGNGSTAGIRILVSAAAAS